MLCLSLNPLMPDSLFLLLASSKFMHIRFSHPYSSLQVIISPPASFWNQSLACSKPFTFQAILVNPDFAYLKKAGQDYHERLIVLSKVSPFTYCHPYHSAPAFIFTLPPLSSPPSFSTPSYPLAFTCLSRAFACPVGLYSFIASSCTFLDSFILTPN